MADPTIRVIKAEVNTLALPNQYQQYKQQSITTMTAGELLVTVYDELIKQIRQGILAIENQDTSLAGTKILKAQEIVNYLESTLNDKYEISEQIRPLYHFFRQQLITANIKKDADILNEILPLVIDFRDTWKQADKLNRMR